MQLRLLGCRLLEPRTGERARGRRLLDLLTPLFQPSGTQLMFFDSSFFSGNTVVLVVAQLSVGAGFVL